MMQLFHKVSRECSEIITRRYSTSFSSAIKLLHKDLRAPIYGIYGFVRLADEIVDTFHDYDKCALLEDFTRQAWRAIDGGISLNPILHSFQEVVRRYNIPRELISAFLHSMAMDLEKKQYANSAELDEYVYGSAEAVGLMCLAVFCEGNAAQYETLKTPARKLGAAFQKINFLRDVQSDYQNLNRAYFPDFDYQHFDDAAKHKIEADIAQDFRESLSGIRALPLKARFGVYTAYRYYFALFKKIKKLRPRKVLETRIRVADMRKLFIVARAGMQYRLNLI